AVATKMIRATGAVGVAIPKVTRAPHSVVGMSAVDRATRAAPRMMMTRGAIHHAAVVVGRDAAVGSGAQRDMHALLRRHGSADVVPGVGLVIVKVMLALPKRPGSVVVAPEAGLEIPRGTPRCQNGPGKKDGVRAVGRATPKAIRAHPSAAGKSGAADRVTP